MIIFIELAPTVGTSRLPQPRPEPRRLDQVVRRVGADSIHPRSSEQIFHKFERRRLRRIGLGRHGWQLAHGLGGELLAGDVHR